MHFTEQMKRMNGSAAEMVSHLSSLTHFFGGQHTTSTYTTLDDATSKQRVRLEVVTILLSCRGAYEPPRWCANE